MASFVATATFVGLAFGLGNWLGAPGIALANGLAYTLEAALLWLLLNSQYKGVIEARKTLIRAVPVALACGLLVYGLLRISIPLPDILFGVVVLGVGGLLAVPFILPEIKLLVKM